MKKKPIVTHERKVIGKVQKDNFTVEIPVECFSAAGANKLFSWGIEEFDTAEIDWQKRTIILTYGTKHYLPEGYVVENMKEVC